MRIIQSVIFNKKKYSPSEAMAWLMENNFDFDKIHTTERYHRFRQFEPEYNNPSKTYITLRSKYPGVKFIAYINKEDLKIRKTGNRNRRVN